MILLRKAMITSSKIKIIDCLKAWAFFWVISTFGGMVAGAVGGGILGFFLGGFGVHMHTIRLLCGGLGFLIGIPISYLVFQLSVSTFLAPKFPSPGEADHQPSA